MKKETTQHPLPEGDRTALLVIDIQHGLFTRSTPIYRADEFLRKVNTLMERSRAAGVPVIFIQHANENTLVRDTPEWQFHPQIQPQPGEPIIHKLQGNAFLNTNLADILRERQASQLVLCGLVTHGCVKSTCIGALELGYRVILVQDGHSSFSKEAPQLIEEWNKKLGKLGAELKAAEEVKF